MARKIYNLIILDKSGSMSSIRNETNYTASQPPQQPAQPSPKP